MSIQAVESRATGAADRFAAFVGETKPADIPQPVFERAKYILLDTVGIMIGAARAPEIARFRSSLVGAARGPSTVFGAPYKTQAATAALVNGSLTTVLQFDEGHRQSMGHPAIHIVPAVLAAGEELDSSGSEVLSALVLGYEVAVRLGRSVFPMRRELHPHGNWATIGAALAVGRLLRLNASRLAELVNCSAMMTQFSWRRATVDGATIHHVLPGLAAQGAITAAYAVRAGLSGPPSSLEQFLLPLVSDGSTASLLDDALGTRWEVLENYFKPYPACAHAHSAIAAMRRLLERRPIEPRDIAEIRVATYPLAATLDACAPKNQLGGMFSIPYNVALLIVRGGHDVGALADQQPLLPEALEVAARVRVSADATLAPPYPLARPARVEVRLCDGSTLDEFVATPPPLAEADGLSSALRAKFMGLATRELPIARAQSLLDDLLNIEQAPSTRRIFLELA
jgi:2-methylcitrate dehydratase PrpD